VDTLLDRFCRYVKVETTSVEEPVNYPSSECQWNLAKMLAEELKQIGVQDVNISEHAIVMGTVPGTVAGAPTIAWLAHMDTSPEASGKDVKPNIIKNYNGQDITLSGDTSKVIRVAEADGLAELKGKTIITTDGTTLLGADDKAGIAVIMTATEALLKDKGIQHGPIRVVFTPDEEVGRGVDKVDIKKVNASCAYTLDGEAEAGLENETFSADKATVTLTGVNIHPGFAKGRMINSIRLAGEFLEMMPKQKSPEQTSDRDGFLHPYIISGTSPNEAGGVPEVKLHILLRSFVTDELRDEEKILQDIAAKLNEKYPRASVKVEVTKQYRNMAEHLAKEPRAVKLAEQAYRNIGVTPKFQSIRGGTDGSRLSEMGLPTPNLSTGMHNFHSPLEFACLEQMETAVKALVELAKLWGKEK